MESWRVVFCGLVIVSLFPTTSLGQGELSEVSFDSVPSNTAFAGGGTAIALQGDTDVSGDLNVNGEIAAGAGIRFPDGTFQTTAGGGGSSANQGLYSNTIVEMVPPNAYTEICIKNGDVFSDIHGPLESTAGGNCLPGDVGWIFERFERNGGAQELWEDARLECLKDGMRLPETFEWKLACRDAGLFALTDMTDNSEWAGNTAIAVGGAGGVFSTALGNGNCNWGSPFTVANSSGNASDNQFRCAR